MTMERGFGVHALEVWQKNSHVKLKEICLCEAAGGMMRTRYQLILVGIKVSFKCCLRKMASEKFVCLIGREECCFRSHTDKSLHNYHYGTFGAKYFSRGSLKIA